VIGRVVKVGAEAKRFRVGDRVGRGWHGAHCFECKSCLIGDFIQCKMHRVLFCSPPPPPPPLLLLFLLHFKFIQKKLITSFICCVRGLRSRAGVRLDGGRWVQRVHGRSVDVAGGSARGPERGRSGAAHVRRSDGVQQSQAPAQTRRIARGGAGRGRTRLLCDPGTAAAAAAAAASLRLFFFLFFLLLSPSSPFSSPYTFHSLMCDVCLPAVCLENGLCGGRHHLP
jgi:hypothetical protein